MAFLDRNEVLIHAGNADEHKFVTVDGERKSRGLRPRNYETHPLGCYAGIVAHDAVDMPLIDQGEWAARLTDMAAQKSQLSDIRLTGNNGQPIPSRDQDGKGYCWAHSSTSAALCLRARDLQPYVSLSAYAIACIIKSYADEGGWGAESCDFATARGIPSEQFWPQQSMSRANDKPETWANAALHKFVEGWIDLQAAQYDRKLSFQQVATCLLCRNPVVSDFNWWSHSVCAIDLVNGASMRSVTRGDNGKLLALDDFEDVWAVDHPVTAGFGVRIWNSWGDSWSDRGMGVLTGNHAIPDGSVAPRTILAAAA